MNKNISTELKIVGITLLIVVLSSLFINKGSRDVHMFDTYIVMDSVSQIIILTLATLFAIGLVGSIVTRFKNKLYVRLLVFSMLLLISGSIYIFASLTTRN